MKKLGLRTEHLGELSADELRVVAGAAGDDMPYTISDGSCGCVPGAGIRIPECNISAGSCLCTGQTR